MDRLYPVRHQKAYAIYSGWIKGVPTLVGYQNGGLLVLSFTPAGELEGVSFMSFNKQEEREAACSMLVASMENVTEPLQVKKFYLDEYSVGIRDYTSSIEEARDDLSGSDYESQEELEADMRLWESTGQYVIDWPEEYIVNPEGFVVSY